MARRHWQPKLGSPGQRVDALDELEQSLRTVLVTPVQSVPGRPGFGSRLFELVDEPVSTLRPAVVREVVRALAVSEPRLRPLGVDPVQVAPGHLEVEVTWHPVGQPETQQRTRVEI